MDAIHLDLRPVVAEHGDERLADCGVRGFASLLGEEAGGGYAFDEPEWFIPQEAVLLGNLVEDDERTVPGCLCNRINLLDHHGIDEQRVELLLLLSGERVLGHICRAGSGSAGPQIRGCGLSPSGEAGRSALDRGTQ
ncbi:hypothetical protein AB5J72_48690 [Streptomyces sp. CG1]|uniref:hypothetical protein n=1 Tax=Streptomyces sp. CG1 TaxID=1287523 RepID=UPI0034E2D6F3